MKHTAKSSACCSVAGMTAMDARGQIVLPKEVRERAGFRPGEKLAIVTLDCGGEICCVGLLRAEGLAGAVGGILGLRPK